MIKVKKLEWEKIESLLFNFPTWKISDPYARKIINFNRYKTLRQAQAAAQREFNAFIRFFIEDK